ncbi:MAG: hypothetical protein AAF480_05075 [Actinomycetota bacterium]
MGQSRDAQRLQRLAKNQVHACVLVDRPKGFARAADARLAAGVDEARPREVIDALCSRLADEDRDPTIEEHLADGVFLGVTATDLVVADTSRISGRPKALIRREPITDIRVRWLDDERQGLRSRILVLEFTDGRWTLLATPWKRLIPDDAVRLVDALGSRARRVPRPEIGSPRG